MIFYFSARTAVVSLQKRYHSDNPHVAHHTLLVLEAAVKNCGEKVKFIFHFMSSIECTDLMRSKIGCILSSMF